MELFQSRTEYTVRGADSCLSCSRSSGSMEVKAASEVNLSRAVCLGLVEGVIGKFQFHPDLECFLILVQRKCLVGTVPGKHDMYKITKVAVIPLTDAEPQDLKLEFCKTHQRPPSDSAEPFFPKKVTGDSSSKQQLSDEKLERRLLEDLVKMFTDSDSFYYSLTYDITNTAQQQQCGTEGQLRTPPRIDDRFFWNKYMIQDLLKQKSAMTDRWIIPIIQGFVQVEEIHVGHDKQPPGESAFSDCLVGEQPPSSPESKFLLVLISRRSRHRGGMRYKRRGVDSDGNVANYVETEQLIYSGDDILSFVQIRGSVPVFWSQEGYRYKPSPKLHKSEEENKQAFQTHFREQFKIYNKQVIINLMNQTGTEKLIADAYLRHFKMLNDPRLIYVAFDFHRQCQGGKFENVEILTDGISRIINDLKWFRPTLSLALMGLQKKKVIGTITEAAEQASRWLWIKRLSKGRVVKVQEGVPRVNCMDNLDRTNIVQTVIARKILEQQLKVLKILPEQHSLPSSIQRIFQIMWANNGDAISRQYAGTAAMKSDFTRTGERRLSGVMKDGYRSANRYYLCHFRHAYRQAIIDMMHGLQMTKGFHKLLENQKLAKALLIKEQRRGQKQEIEALILYCTLLLIPAAEKRLGGWLFIDCDPRLKGSAEQNLDMVLLVSSEACYFAHINKESEVSHSRRIALSEVNRIEIECLQAIADTVRNAKQEATGENLPIHAEKRQCNRFMTGMWNLLRLFLKLLVTTIKICRLRSRKVDTSAGDLVEESSSAPESAIRETPELRGDIPCSIEPQELDALHPPDQEVGHERVISIHLPKDSTATLQVSHDTDTSDTESPSGSSWLTEGNYELISLKSTSSASTLWTTSSFSSDQDSSEDELSQTCNSPDVYQLRETTWRRVPSAHRIGESAQAFLVEGLGQPSQQQPALLSVPGREGSRPLEGPRHPAGTQGEPGPEVPAFAGAGSPWASPLPLAHLGQRR